MITNEARAEDSPLARKVAEQAEIMRLQVNHYLDRAQIAARSKVIGAVTEVEPVVASLVRAMRRIHGDAGITLTADVPPEARFKGEKQDLEEILGNLVDNACKWAKASVAVTVSYRKPEDGGSPGQFELIIEIVVVGSRINSHTGNIRRVVQCEIVGLSEIKQMRIFTRRCH